MTGNRFQGAFQHHEAQGKRLIWGIMKEWLAEEWLLDKHYFGNYRRSHIIMTCFNIIQIMLRFSTAICNWTRIPKIQIVWVKRPRYEWEWNILFNDVVNVMTHNMIAFIEQLNLATRIYLNRSGVLLSFYFIFFAQKVSENDPYPTVKFGCRSELSKQLSRHDPTRTTKILPVENSAVYATRKYTWFDFDHYFESNGVCDETAMKQANEPSAPCLCAAEFAASSPIGIKKRKNFCFLFCFWFIIPGFVQFTLEKY